MKTKRNRKARSTRVKSEGSPRGVKTQSTNIQVHISAAEEELMQDMQQRTEDVPALGRPDTREFFRQLGSIDRDL